MLYFNRTFLHIEVNIIYMCFTVVFLQIDRYLLSPPLMSTKKVSFTGSTLWKKQMCEFNHKEILLARNNCRCDEVLGMLP